MLKTKSHGVTLYGFATDDKVHEHGGNLYVDIHDKWDYGNGPSDCHYVRIGDLLGDDTTSLKLAKSRIETDYFSVIHYGAPAQESGYEMCSHRTRACSELCLNTAGNGRYQSVQIYRIAKTRLLKLRPDLFWRLWRKQLAAKKRKAERLGRNLACRPNGTTDHWDETTTEHVRNNPDTEFYDYTAVPSRLEVADKLTNYHVTLSRKGTKRNLDWLREHYGKRNIAVVVTEEVKEELLRRGSVKGIEVRDFDKHDLRLPDYDGQGVIGLLTPKGKARGKVSEFIVTTVAQLEAEIG